MRHRYLSAKRVTSVMTDHSSRSRSGMISRRQKMLPACWIVICSAKYRNLGKDRVGVSNNNAILESALFISLALSLSLSLYLSDAHASTHAQRKEE